jgi:hypothetical protein
LNGVAIAKRDNGQRSAVFTTYIQVFHCSGQLVR